MTFLVQAMGYGFAAGTSPGPFLSYLFSVTLAHGWRRGGVVVFAPLLADIPIVLVAVFVLGQLPDSVLRIIRVVGGIYVLWLAWLTWKSLQAGATIEGDEDIATISKSQTLRYAIIMIYLSPGPYIFWGTVNGPLLRDALDESLFFGLGMLIGFYGTFLLLLGAWVGVFDRLRRVDPRLTYYTLMLTVVVLVILGLSLLKDGILG